jgi:ubiquinone/menaquinone biosynthesis C-methylase UbiE
MDLSHVPDEVIAAGQGCSSPLADAVCSLSEGSTIVDLGCGAGLDVFIAARIVGASGEAIGIDMTPEMLAVAARNAPEVAARIGFSNVRFIQSPIEELPLPDGCADVVISNCVINLSDGKERVFAEIYRVLKPGGCFIISDVYAEQSVPESIKNDEKFISMCIGGAMEEDEFYRITEGAGFREVHPIHKDDYAEAGGCRFTAMTQTGLKPSVNGSDN